MIDLSTHIEHLLRTHDSVALPGLGAFFAEYIPARIDVSASEIMPPVRTLSFNSRIIRDDDRLLAGMMRRHHYSRATAIEAIDAAIEAIRGALSMTGRCKFGSLGDFVTDADGQPAFIPADMMPLSVNPYGLLPRVPVTSVIAAARAEAGIPGVATDARESEVTASPIFLPSRQSRRYWGRIAAMLAIIATFGIAFINSDSDRGHTRPSLAAIASYSGSSQAKPLDCELYVAYPDHNEATATVHPAVPEHRDGSPNTADNKPADNNRRVYGLGNNGNQPSQQPAQPAPQQPAQPSQQPSQPAPQQPQAAQSSHHSAPAAAQPQPQPQQASANESTLAKVGRFALIIASLASRDEALRFIANDGNPNLEIIEADGRYRVAISRSDSRASLEQQQPNVASKYKGAWIYAAKP